MIIMNIAVRVMRVQAERYVEPEDPLPPNLQISVNMNLGKIEGSKERAKGRFLIDVSYQPSVGRVTVEGRVIITGRREEIERMMKDIGAGKMPQPVVQAVYAAGFSEAVMLCRSIGVPPPLPPLPQPQQEGKGKSEGMEYSL